MGEKQEELDSLFKKWKEWWKKPEYEAVYTYRKKPKCCFEHKNYKGRRDWFFPDGFLGNENNCKILFISKESHEKGPYKNNNTGFWMRRMVSSDNFNKVDYENNGIIYPRRMAAIYNKLFSNDGSECNYMENDFSKLKNCGYMNLNKHGGEAKTPQKPFEGLVEADKCYIKRQIEIMKPKKIVMLGVGLADLLKDIKIESGENMNIPVYETFHPRASKTYNDYIDKLNQPMLKINEEGVLQWNESKE